MDKTADPCVDFYQYACGGWMANNPIPPDQSGWNRFAQLHESNQTQLRGLLEKAADASKKRDVSEQKTGDFYSSCMDEGKIESLGTKPIADILADIDKISSQKDLIKEIVRLAKDGMNPLFRSGSDQDAKDATRVILGIDQGGLGLPDRDYYLKTDPHSTKLREQYVEHVAKMLALSGETKEAAASGAKAVLDLETELAKASQDKVARRDPANTYHPVKFDELAALMPVMNWNAYFSAQDLKKSYGINVGSPDFFKRENELLAQQPLSVWKTYLRWHVASASSALLPSAFVNEDFDFYAKTMRGAKELQPRWKRCTDLTGYALGFALGRKYVEQYFDQTSKERTLNMVKNIEGTLGGDIKTLDWMSPKTKENALKKLAKIENKIGYPEKWRDYSKLKIKPGDAMGNMRRARYFEAHRDLNKIGKPLDRTEWGMTPPTVNAYYSSNMNSINFPAGILQPPFFGRDRDEWVNYGAIGAVIGHEMTHGFDDEGRKFDADGNMVGWWTDEDAKAFEQRAQCLVDQYSQFVATADVKLNGKLTLGENTADNGGLRMAFMAMEAQNAGKPANLIDGFTPEQRLFLGWGQIYCENRTPESARMGALTDPHSPGRARVNDVLQNMEGFAKAFACKQGQPMVPANPCRIW